MEQPIQMFVNLAILLACVAMDQIMATVFNAQDT